MTEDFVLSDDDNDSDAENTSKECSRQTNEEQVHTHFIIIISKRNNTCRSLVLQYPAFVNRIKSYVKSFVNDVKVAAASIKLRASLLAHACWRSTFLSVIYLHLDRHAQDEAFSQVEHYPAFNTLRWRPHADVS